MSQEFKFKEVHIANSLRKKNTPSSQAELDKLRVDTLTQLIQPIIQDTREIDSRGSPPSPASQKDNPGQWVNPYNPATVKENSDRMLRLLKKSERPGEHDYFDRKCREAERVQYEQKMAAKNALKENFKESERILNLLRTQGANTIQEATEEEINTWAKRLPQSWNRK